MKNDSTNGLSSGSSVAIIGAGIIGVASAYALARRGYEVVVYDPSPPGEAGPSRANAGHIAASDIYPLSTQGIHWKALQMLMNRDGALKVPPGEFIRQIPWFWQFWRTSQHDRFQVASNALSYLCNNTLADTLEMLDAAGMNDMLIHNGCAFLYDTDKGYNASQSAWAGKNTAGFSSEEMTNDRIARDIPVVTDRFQKGVLSHHWAMVKEPFDMVKQLARAAELQGVTFRQAGVTRLSGHSDAVTLETNTGTHQHEVVIIAAGVHSVKFARCCGDYLPMASERGYNLTFPNPDIKLDLPLVFADRGVVATHLSSGLRVGGWAEYASPDRPPNQAYFKALSRISQELFPGLNQENATCWMGNRPSLPDSVPVISRSSHMGRVFYNCGHGHYGLTHAATSAQILCNLMDNLVVNEKYEQYAISRFAK